MIAPNPGAKANAPNASKAVNLDFRQIAQTRLPCGATVPAFVCQYYLASHAESDTISRDLLLGVDGIDLARVEELAHLLADLGVSLVPIPLAPQHNEFTPDTTAANRSWTIPEESTIKAHAEEVCRRQVTGFVQLFSNQGEWEKRPWAAQSGEGLLWEEVLRCLNEVLCRV